MIYYNNIVRSIVIKIRSLSEKHSLVQPGIVGLYARNHSS